MKSLLRGRGAAEPGQSLVEIAIVAPLLIFMMIGVLEVGWALRSYLVLVNVNREITRFAVRPGYLDFSTTTSVNESYQRIRDWVDTALVNQLDLDFNTDDNNSDGFGDGNATLIISHFVADTGLPCAPGDPACNDCSNFDDSDFNPFPWDDLVINPGMDGFAYQATRVGPPATVTGPRNTRVNYEELAKSLKADNNKFNCELLKRGGVPSANNVIMTELFYDQPQLFGFPLISNPFTDPVLMYTQTTMRLIGAARSSGTAEGNLTKNISSIGPVCVVQPFLVDAGAGINHGQIVNLVGTGWLKWDPSASDEAEFIDYSVQFPQMSVDKFTDPSGGTNALKVGSRVAKITGQQPAAEAALDNLVGQNILVPYSTNAAGSPVKIDGFVWATIQAEGDITLNTGTNGEVKALLDLNTDLPEACQ